MSAGGIGVFVCAVCAPKKTIFKCFHVSKLIRSSVWSGEYEGPDRLDSTTTCGSIGFQEVLALRRFHSRMACWPPPNVHPPLFYAARLCQHAAHKARNVHIPRDLVPPCRMVRWSVGTDGNDKHSSDAMTTPTTTTIVTIVGFVVLELPSMAIDINGFIQFGKRCISAQLNGGSVCVSACVFRACLSVQWDPTQLRIFWSSARFFWFLMFVLFLGLGTWSGDNENVTFQIHSYASLVECSSVLVQYARLTVRGQTRACPTT